MFWRLRNAASASVGVGFANSVEIGFVVAVPGFELVEDTGSLSFCSLGNAQLSSNSPGELCGIGSGVLLNCEWSVFGDMLGPFVSGQVLDFDASESQTCHA